MNYIVFDLEFNQALDHKEDEEKHKRCPFEIIQIGAIKLNDALETIGHFDMYIKPSIYPTLHPFIKKMTGITEEQVKTAHLFSDVYSKFSQFIDKNDILCVWGTSDMKELFRNIHYHQLDDQFIPRQYINVQQPVSKLFQFPRGGNIGLRNAVELLQLPAEHPFHSAIHDAHYTAEIFKKIYTEQLQPLLYDFQPRREELPQPKTKLDIKSLYHQFEKMFDTPLTDKEKQMIKLAYLMGKSRQFQIPLKPKREKE